MYNPLYNQVYKFVSDALDARAKAHLNTELKWSYQKTCYCFVESICDSSSSNDGKVLARMGHMQDQKGGYDEIYKNRNEEAFKGVSPPGEESMYKRKNFPSTPMLKNVSITNEGKMGSLQKASISFTIMDATLFDIYEELFMRPGREIKVKYGWSQTADNESACADHSIFRGIVSNCNWNINDKLGYDCSIDCVGEGFFTINAEATTIQEDGGEYIDGNVALKALDLKSQINLDIAQISKENGEEEKGYFEGLPTEGGNSPLVYYRQKIKTIELEDSTRAADISKVEAKSGGLFGLGTQSPEEQVMYYLSLNELVKYYQQRIVKLIGKRLGDSKSEQDDKISYFISPNKKIVFSSDLEAQEKISGGDLCKDPDVTCGTLKSKESLDNKHTIYSCSSYVNLLRSANPLKVLFPSEKNADYGSEAGGATYYPEESGKYKPRFDKRSDGGEYFCNAKLVNLGEIYISTDLITEIYDKLSEKQDTPLNQTIINFFNEIFNEISKNSGGLYQLTIVSNEIVSSVKDSEDSSYILIQNTVVDKNFTTPVQIKPYIFSPRVHKALMHEFNMSSQLPSATQTAMYAGGRTKVSQNVASNDGFSKLQQRYFDSCGGAKDGDDNPTQKAVENAKNDTKKDNNIEVKSWFKRWEEVTLLIGQNGMNDAYQNELIAIMKQLKNRPDDFDGQESGHSHPGSWVKRTLYPINFSIKVDGISGFRFGNVLSSDWLPKKYRYENNYDNFAVVFIITKVIHDIDRYKWTTTLETQCRPES